MTFYEREWFSPSIWISPFYSVLFARSVPYLFFLEGVWVRSTEVENMENMIQEWYVFKKKKYRERKEWLSRCCMVLKTSLFPTEGMVDVVAYLVTCWPDCEREKKLKFVSELTIERKKKWNLLRWLIVVDWVQIRSFQWVLLFYGWPPFSSLFSFRHPFEFDRKN